LVAEHQSREQADIATAVSDFLTRDVIQAVNPYRNTLDIRLVDALKAGGARIDARFAGNPRLIGIVRRELADSLYLAGETEPARAQAQLALDALQNAFGASDTDALRARVTLGRILHKQDEYEKSRAVYTEGLKAVAPSTPDDVRLAFPVGLAGLDMEDRHEAEAVEQLDKLIPEIEAKVGVLEQVHVDALDNQLRAYMGLERFDEGLAVARRLRSATEAKFGVGDPQTLEWLKREAIVLSNMDRNEDALPIMHKACDATQASLGNGHYATQDCNLRLGVILFNLSRFDEAALLFEPAVAYREKSQGNDSESTWLSWIWLARARQHTGRTNDARVLFERAQQNAVRVFGDGDAKALPFGQTLGMFLEQTGSHEDAERMRKKLLDQSRKALGEENIITAKMAWDLGETMASQQHDKDTVAFFEPWLPQWERLFGEKDDRVTDAKLWLSAARERLAIGAR
jgi:tetratricopeptide (TPR) repeat protein